MIIYEYQWLHPGQYRKHPGKQWGGCLECGDFWSNLCLICLAYHVNLSISFCHSSLQNFNSSNKSCWKNHLKASKHNCSLTGISCILSAMSSFKPLVYTFDFQLCQHIPKKYRDDSLIWQYGCRFGNRLLEMCNFCLGKTMMFLWCSLVSNHFQLISASICCN